ncbi:MAG: hypothetical protein JXJ17_10815 [Anaerolineae bacterium]|nr:hypothetical protein [Anaerolineae bacterium]
MSKKHIGIVCPLAMIAAIMLLAACSPSPDEIPGAYADQYRDYEADIKVTGTTYHYYVYMPEEISAALPVVLVMHGYNSSADDLHQFGFEELGEEEGFIVVYPENPSGWWKSHSGDPWAMDDLAFLNALLDQLEQDLPIDTSRIYMTGHSNGSMITGYSACELSDRIAAFGAIAGPITVKASQECSADRPIPIVHMHGTADPTVLFDERITLPGTQGLTAQEAMDFWVAHNGCDSTPTVDPPIDELDDGTSVIRAVYTGCDGGIELPFYTMEGTGHTWPGVADDDWGDLGIASKEISGAKVIWEYVSQYSLPQ